MSFSQDHRNHRAPAKITKWGGKGNGNKEKQHNLEIDRSTACIVLLRANNPCRVKGSLIV